MKYFDWPLLLQLPTNNNLLECWYIRNTSAVSKQITAYTWSWRWKSTRCRKGSGIATESPILTPQPWTMLYTVTLQQVDSESTIQNVLSPAAIHTRTHARTHTRLTTHFQGLPRWAGTRKIKPIWILLKQGTVSGSGISWAICKSAPCSRQITTPAPHHSVLYRPDALPAAQPTAAKHWRHLYIHLVFV